MTKSHKEESLSPLRLFCPRVFTPEEDGGEDEEERIVVIISLLLFLKQILGERQTRERNLSRDKTRSR